LVNKNSLEESSSSGNSGEDTTGDRGVLGSAASDDGSRGTGGRGDEAANGTGRGREDRGGRLEGGRGHWGLGRRRRDRDHSRRGRWRLSSRRGGHGADGGADRHNDRGDAGAVRRARGNRRRAAGHGADRGRVDGAGSPHARGSAPGHGRLDIRGTERVGIKLGSRSEGHEAEGEDSLHCEMARVVFVCVWVGVLVVKRNPTSSQRVTRTSGWYRWTLKVE